MVVGNSDGWFRHRVKMLDCSAGGKWKYRFSKRTTMRPLPSRSRLHQIRKHNRIGKASREKIDVTMVRANMVDLCVNLGHRIEAQNVDTLIFSQVAK